MENRLADENSSERIKEAIGDIVFPLQPVIVRSIESYTWGINLAHPSCNAVSIFRDLSATDSSR
ncbi:hypothetical protein N7456_004316 [Penicillium angulare]|uniref:Uncharacterized protein n=1 Tax=Penicillium angulare TaxID=116970 RepID=A0A9W9KJ38_9EURO|nr:hypothetical protein N7456_004316 [Penicillium angulare]